MWLLLFDIDGTLVRADGAGAAALRSAVASVTGQPATTDGVAFAGRTDPAIFRDVLRANGLSVEPDLLNAVMEAYVEEARATLHEDNVGRLPGTASLLSLLSERDDVYLGLVTGNVEPIAFHKLRMAGLAQYFAVGGFGSDHAVRANLPSLAVQRATTHSGHAFSLNDTVVIGDTPHDVDCAREAGARAMAVSTGHPTHEELAAHTPDLLVDGFDDPENMVRRILNIFDEDSPTPQSRHDL